MSELYTLASAAGMTVAWPCVHDCRFNTGDDFRRWESARWRPLAWLGTGLVTLFRACRKSCGAVIYFGASQLLLTLSEASPLTWVRSNPGSGRH